MTLENWKKCALGCEMAVIGIGVSNLPLIRFLTDCGAKVSAHDKRSAEQLGETYAELKKLNVNLVLGDDYLKNISPSAKIIFKTPGIRYDVPELLKAVRFLHTPKALAQESQQHMPHLNGTVLV